MTPLYWLVEVLETVVVLRTLPLVRRQNPGAGRI